MVIYRAFFFISIYKMRVYARIMRAHARTHYARKKFFKKNAYFLLTNVFACNIINKAAEFEVKKFKKIKKS